MIRSWAGGVTRRFAETGKSKFSGMDVEIAEKRLVALAAATSLADLTPLKSVGLHKLTGARKNAQESVGNDDQRAMAAVFPFQGR